MDVSPILSPLNDAQRQAVTAEAGNLLVLAGAGSGKTRVLVHRIAWLIQIEGVSPGSILAVTFTNKAASEMRLRIEELLERPIGGMWVGTFHGLAHRLRLHWREAGLLQSFQILDSEDQLRLIKKIVKALELDENRWVPREVQYFINKHKDEGRRPQHLKDSGDPTQRQMIRLYAEYEQLRPCRRGGFCRTAAAPSNCGATSRICCVTTAHASGTCWWTNSRIRIPSSTPGSGCWWVQRASVRGRRRRSIDLPLARGARREPAGIRRIFRRPPVPPGAELSLHRRDTRCRESLIAHNSARLGKNLWTSGGRGRR
jgi:DNA helicase-2/ATP-dependent DNA helicase PcrA